MVEHLAACVFFLIPSRSSESQSAVSALTHFGTYGRPAPGVSGVFSPPTLSVSQSVSPPPPPPPVHAALITHLSDLPRNDPSNLFFCQNTLQTNVRSEFNEFVVATQDK